MEKGDCIFVRETDCPAIVISDDREHRTITVDEYRPSIARPITRTIPYEHLRSCRAADFLSEANKHEAKTKNFRRVYAIWCGEHLDRPNPRVEPWEIRTELRVLAQVLLASLRPGNEEYRSSDIRAAMKHSSRAIDLFDDLEQAWWEEGDGKR